MKTIKRIFIVLTLVLSVGVLSNSVFAAEKQKNVDTVVSSEYVLTSPEEIKAYLIESGDYEIDASKISEIKVIDYSFDKQNDYTPTLPMRRFWQPKWEIKNKETLTKYGSYKTLDDYEGPTSVTVTYSKEFSVSLKTSSKVDAGVIEAELGVEIGSKVTLSRAYTVTAGKGETVYVRFRQKNEETKFDVYRNNKFEKSGTVIEPVGMSFSQYTIKK